MRPTHSRILLSAIAIGSLAGGVFTSQLVFFVVALGAGMLLGMSLSRAKQRANDMQPSTPVERQISGLSRYEGRGFRVAIVLLCIAPIVLVTLAVMNLQGAATHAKLANSSLTAVFRLWLNGPLPEATYSGHLVLALEGIDTAVFQLADAPIALIVILALRRRRKNARELLALLKAYGE